MTAPRNARSVAPLLLAMGLALAACRGATTPPDQDAMPPSSPPPASAAPAPPPPVTEARGGRSPKGLLELANAERMSEPLEQHLFELMSPYGSDQHVRVRQASAEWLVEHADASYPRLIAALRARPDAVNAPVIIEILPRFRRSESIPVLEDALGRGLDRTARAAGIALGRHEGDRAREALVRALSSLFPETVAGAADGFAERADPSTCGALVAVVAHPDAITRWHVVQAAGKLGCLSMEALNRLEASDPDGEVRALAKKLKEDAAGPRH